MDTCGIIDKLKKINDAGLIDFFGIVVNVILAILVANFVQKTVTNKRFYKDYFIGEFKLIKAEYNDLVKSILQGNYNAKNIIPQFKLLKIKCNCLITLINTEKNIVVSTYFDNYHIDLLSAVSNSNSFSRDFQNDANLSLEESEKRTILRELQKYAAVFEPVILGINDL